MIQSDMTDSMKKITVASTAVRIEREPLLRPMGFKGGYLSELWQVAACMRGESGTTGDDMHKADEKEIDTPVGVAIIGTGLIARFHADAVKSSDKLRLVRDLKAEKVDEQDNGFVKGDA